MRLRLQHAHGDREPVGYITDEPAFSYEIADDAPQRAAVLELIEASTEWTAPRYGGADDSDSSCGGYSRVPATDRDRVVLLERRIRQLEYLSTKRIEE